ncbi:hypothetical protein DFS33DRAFT_1277442 [Desarmillaria ectypa]|nr:hypothetical protein DFS33DRAFT_1277442 [Desarmillaria ectypa]
MSVIRTPRLKGNVRKPYSLAESTVTASRHTTTKKNAPISPLHLFQFRIISSNYFDALPTDAALEDYALTNQERSLLISWTLDGDSVDKDTLHPRLVELLPELSLKTRCHGVDLLLHRGRPVAIREELASIIISTHAEKHANGASNYHIIDKRFACVPASLVLAWAMSCPSCTKENTRPTRTPKDPISVATVLPPLSKPETVKKPFPLHSSTNDKCQKPMSQPGQSKATLFLCGLPTMSKAFCPEVFNDVLKPGATPQRTFSPEQAPHVTAEDIEAAEILVQIYPYWHYYPVTSPYTNYRFVLYLSRVERFSLGWMILVWTFVMSSVFQARFECRPSSAQDHFSMDQALFLVRKLSSRLRAEGVHVFASGLIYGHAECWLIFVADPHIFHFLQRNANTSNEWEYFKKPELVHGYPTADVCPCSSFLRAVKHGKSLGDIPSAGYQFSFAPYADWPEFYSYAGNIKKYLRHKVTAAVYDVTSGTRDITVEDLATAQISRETYGIFVPATGVLKE